MATPEKYAKKTVGVYPDPEGSGGYGIEATAWTGDAWNKRQEDIRRYQEDQEWQRNHPYLAGARTGFDNALNWITSSNDYQSLLGNRRVQGMARAWQRNPEYMKSAWTDTGNAVGIAAASPYLIYTAPTWAPWAARTAVEGLKWRYTTPSGWVLGTAAELPAFAQAVDNDNAQPDNRTNIERAWDWATDHPWQTMGILTGLSGAQTAYNWATGKWSPTNPNTSTPNTSSTPSASINVDEYPPDYQFAGDNNASRVNNPNPAKGKGIGFMRRGRNYIKTNFFNKGFLKKNWLAPVTGAAGAAYFLDWLFSNPDEQKNNAADNPQNAQNPQASQNTGNDSVKQYNLPSGFRPVQGVNDQGQIVVPSSSGEPDSIITIEPYENRFSSEENNNQ